MEPRQYVTALLRSWYILLLACVVGGGLAYGVGSSRTPSYEAQAVTQLGVPVVANGSELWQTTNANVVLASSYTQLVSSPMVTTPAAKEVGDITSDQIAAKVSAKAPLETLNIVVTATDTDPERAAKIATAVAKSMQGAVAEIAPRNTEGKPAVVLHLTQEATTPKSPTGLSATLFTGIGAAGGLALGALVALIRRPKDESDTENPEALTDAPEPENEDLA